MNNLNNFNDMFINGNMPNNYQRSFDALDVLAVASFIIQIQNLYENREQTAQNNVDAANNKQEAHMLSEINALFNRQEMLLECQANLLDKLTKKIDDIERRLNERQ